MLLLYTVITCEIFLLTPKVPRNLVHVKAYTEHEQPAAAKGGYQFNCHFLILEELCVS